MDVVLGERRVLTLRQVVSRPAGGEQRDLQDLAFLPLGEPGVQGVLEPLGQLVEGEGLRKAGELRKTGGGRGRSLRLLRGRSFSLDISWNLGKIWRRIRGLDLDHIRPRLCWRLKGDLNVGLRPQDVGPVQRVLVLVL